MILFKRRDNKATCHFENCHRVFTMLTSLLESFSERKGLSRLNAAVRATAPLKTASWDVERESASRSIRECRGLTGNPDIALPSDCNSFVSSSIAPRVIKVFSASARASLSKVQTKNEEYSQTNNVISDSYLDGGVGKGKFTTFSMPIAFICRTVPSMGTLDIAGSS